VNKSDDFELILERAAAICADLGVNNLDEALTVIEGKEAEDDYDK
jgi:hypothetical protein